MACPSQYPGIENVPVQTASPEWVSFQGKRGQDGRENDDNLVVLRKVIEPVRNEEYQLDKTFCSSSAAPNTAIALTAEQRCVVDDLKAVGMSVEWYDQLDCVSKTRLESALISRLGWSL